MTIRKATHLIYTILLHIAAIASCAHVAYKLITGDCGTAMQIYYCVYIWLLSMMQGALMGMTVKERKKK